MTVYLLKRKGIFVICFFLLFCQSGYCSASRVLQVRKDAVADHKALFNTIGEALKISRKGDVVQIFEGIYKESGLLVPDSVSIVGIGWVVIQGELPDHVSSKELESTSTIDMFNNGHLENLTVTARNMRYPVHSDFSRGNTRQTVINCRFIHYGNSGAYQYRVAHHSESPDSPTDVMRVQSAWGGGTKGGDKRYFRICYFESPVRAFSTHNNVGFNKTFGASLTILEDCQMVSHGTDLDGSDLGFCAPVVIQNLPSESPDKVILSDCHINGFLCFQNKPTHAVYCNSTGLRIIFHTAGGSKSMNNQDNILKQSVTWYPFLIREMSNLKNLDTRTVVRGQAVKRSRYGMERMTATDDVSAFYGVAMQTIPPGKSGDIKYKGFLPAAYFLGLDAARFTEGDRIGVLDDGSFGVNAGKIIGEVVDNGNIRILCIS